MSIAGSQTSAEIAAARSPDATTHDYVSPGLIEVTPDSAFPFMIAGDPARNDWPFLRREITHTWYVDSRHPDIGFLTRDEAAIVHNTALQFADAPCLEIGCWRGWSTAHIALAVNRLHVIDPALLDETFEREVRESSRAAGVLDKITIHPGFSPGKVDAISPANAPWAFAFIDGDHEGDGPVRDAAAVSAHAADDAIILFHDLVSPHVAAALAFLRERGWNTMIYQTMQIMGVAWRGNARPVDHMPDPTQSWTIPEHLVSFRVAGDQHSERREAGTELAAAPSAATGVIMNTSSAERGLSSMPANGNAPAPSDSEGRSPQAKSPEAAPAPPPQDTALKAQIEALEADLRSSKSEIAAARVERECREREIGEMLAEIERLKNAVQARDAHFAKFKKETETGFERTREALRHAQTEHAEKVKWLNDELAKARQAARANADALRNAKEQARTAESRAEILLNTAKHTAEMTQQSLREESKRTLEQAKTDHAKAIIALRSQLTEESLKARQEFAAQLSAATIELQALVTQETAKAAELGRKLEDSERARRSLVERTEAAVLAAERAAREAAISHERAEEAERQILLRRAESAEAAEAAAGLEDEARRLRIELAAATADQAALTAELSELREQSSLAQSQRDEARTRLQALEESRRLLETMLQTARAEFQAESRERISAAALASSAMEESAALQRQLSQLSQNLAALEESARRADAEREMLVRRFSEACQDKADLSIRLRETSEKFKALRNGTGVKLFAAAYTGPVNILALVGLNVLGRRDAAADRVRRLLHAADLDAYATDEIVRGFASLGALVRVTARRWLSSRERFLRGVAWRLRL